MFLKIITKKDEKVIAEKAILADSFLKRARGLMFSNSMDGFDALVIKPCKSVHTFFMNYPIDIIFLNNDFKIIAIEREMKPWRMTPIYFSATEVIELKGGHVDRGLRKGDELEILCTN